jgi:hypothetical protein
MATQGDVAPSVERRRHPRSQVTIPMVLRSRGGEPVPCETVDRSIGGARVVATEIIPLGPCDVVLEGETEAEGRAAEVLATTVDAERGVVVARLRFLDVGTQSPARTRRARVLVAVLAVAVAAGSAAVLARLGGDDDKAPRLRGAASATGPTRVETSDSSLTIIVTNDPGETVALSAAEESATEDAVEIRLATEPPTTALQIPVVVTLVNHGGDALSFGDGLHATVRARRASADAAEVVLSADAERLAPGASTVVSGVIVLPAPGSYELDVSVPVSS